MTEDHRTTQATSHALGHAWIEMNSSALSPTLMRPCPERRAVSVGCLYFEIEGQSCLVGNVDQGLMKKGQTDLSDRTTQKRARKKIIVFPHSDVTRNLSANNPKKKFGNFLAKYRLSIVIGLNHPPKKVILREKEMKAAEKIPWCRCKNCHSARQECHSHGLGT